MIMIGSSEARTHLSALLRRVEEGEEITITRHGHPVARLVPVGGAPMPHPGELVDRLLSFRRHHTLGPGLTVRDLIDEGRR